MQASHEWINEANKSGNENEVSEITIKLTEPQKRFLKLFAKNHYPNAKDNLCTYQPIHVVQSYNPRHIPFGEDSAEYFNDDDLRFCWDHDYYLWFKSDVKAIEGWYEYCSSEECPIPIRPFSEVEYANMTDVKGEKVHISNYDDYFKAYGIEWVVIAWEQEGWQDIAFFFILEEAKRFMDYQGHNLKNPRTYTYSCGYGNEGEYHHFFQLLFDIGDKLNKEQEVNQLITKEVLG